MSIVEVARVAGVTSADVHRVLFHGGTTADDWAIAHAIEQVTGRDAYEFMMSAGRSAEIAEIWADSRTDATPVAPTNPRAVHDPETVIYGEDTSPESPNRIAPHHPGDHEEIVEEQDEQATAEQLADAVLADLAEVLDDAAAAIRLTRAWSTPTEGRQVLSLVLETDPRRWVREELALHAAALAG